MKYLTFILLVLSLFSCNKTPDDVVAGEINDLLYLNHNKVIKGEFVSVDDYEAIVPLDVDEDGLVDFRFRSTHYIAPSTSNVSYKVDVEIVNSNYAIAVEALGTEYYTEGAPVIDVFGTYPRTTNYVTYSCGSMDATSLESGHFDYPKQFASGEIVNSSLNFTNAASRVTLHRTAEVTSEYSPTYDSGGVNVTGFVGTETTLDANCTFYPFDTELFMPILESIDGKNNYGWVKLKLEDVNQLTVMSSAIQ